MKYLIASLIYLFSTVPFVQAQSELLLDKTWKISESSMIFGNIRIIYFHKDSSVNMIDYSNAELKFFSDGTYSVTSQADTLKMSGVWSLKSKGDSVMIDSADYFLVKLVPDSFITRNYTLEFADSLANLDTAYSYFKYYDATPVTPSVSEVSLLSFTGSYANEQVQLKWSTGKEYNNKYFDVQYGTDENNFETIGRVESKGNSNTQIDYMYPASKYKEGANYYRLKQVDAFEKFTYSQKVTVTVAPPGPAASAISIYPNPARGSLVVSFGRQGANQVQLRLKDAIGQTVLSKTITTGSGTENISLTGIAKGLYFVEIINNKNEKLLTGKLVVQ